MSRRVQLHWCRPGAIRYSGSVSGPQLAVPRPRWAASRWMTVSATGVRSTSWVAAARSAARWWVTETWLGVSEVDPEAATGTRLAELQPAHVGVTAVLLGPDVRDVLVGDRRRPAADEARPLAIRVGLVRAGAEPAQALRPGHDLEDRADAAEVVQLVGDVDALGDGDPAVGEGRVGGLVRDDDRAAVGDVRVADRGRRAGPLDRARAAFQLVHAPLAPARGHPADPVVVGRGAPQRERRRRRQERMDEAAVVVDLDGPIAGRWPAAGGAGAGVPSQTASWRAHTSKPAGAHAVASAVVTVTVRKASPVAPSGVSQPGRATVRPLARTQVRQVERRRRRPRRRPWSGCTGRGASRDR